MSIFSRLAEKSWETPGAEAHLDPASYRPEAARVGLWVYLAVATVLFALITAAYLMRMMTHGETFEVVHDWRSIPRPTLLWVNTGVLVVASIVWEAARSAARHDRAAKVRDSLIFAGVLGLLFLTGQLIVWRQLQEAGYFLAGPALCLSDWSNLGQPALHFVSSNPAIGFFYLITTIHGLHIGGGLVAWGRAISQAASGVDVRGIVGLSATYWHFLLIVWLAMFGLLLST